jgi:RNA 3'-terminal phosphate cyclase (ATP)
LVEIDGSQGEGGGQIVRTALALAAVTGRPLRISRIREKRSEPGLRPQHLAAARAVSRLCGGTLDGAAIGSRELRFEPGPIAGGAHDFEVGTAGAVTLVAQALLPVALLAPAESVLRIAGGTHVHWAPTTDYLEEVFLPAAARLGVVAAARTLRPGFFPVGGGRFELSVRPSRLRGCAEWPRGGEPAARVRLAKLPRGIAERERGVLEAAGIRRVEIREDEAASPGNAVTVWCAARGASSIGERGRPAERVAREAAAAFAAETAEVDRHLADQLLPIAALAEGPTSFRTSAITEHLRTHARVIEALLPRRVTILEEEAAVTVE